MDWPRDPLFRHLLRSYLLMWAGVVMGAAISFALQINQPHDKMLIIVCCAVPVTLFGRLFSGAKFAKEIERQAEEEARAWDRAVNAGAPNPDDTSESS